MNTRQNSCVHHRSERGQSMLGISIGLAAVLLLAVGVVMASMALFTSYAMNDPEKSSAISEWVDTTDGFSHAMQDAMVSPTATPSLGAVVGNQAYLADPVNAYTQVEFNSQ